MRGNDIVIAPVKASTAIYKGGLLEYNGGYLQPWNPSDGYPFAGIAQSGTTIPIVGSGANVVGTSDGWTSIPVRRTGLHKFVYSAAAITNIGSLAYASDDNTIVLVSNGAPMGIVVDYESGYLWIDITGYTVPAETAINTFPVDLSLATGTGTTGVAMRIGTTGSPVALNTAGQRGVQEYFSTTATSDTTYGRYTQLKAYGAGLEAIAVRARLLGSLAGIGNAHGLHATLELDTSAGSVTGLGTGLRANIVLPGRALPAGGTYYGLMAEIYSNASADISAVTEHAILAVQANGDTSAKAKVLNAISFAGTDGTGKMIYTATDSAPTMTGSIRILVNGAVRYLHFSSAQAANS
jgi:hypothetical protein